MISARGVHHVALRVADVESMAAFYGRLLGLRTTATHRDARGHVRSIWLAAGETIVMLERRQRGEPEIPAGSMEAVIFAIAEIDRPTFERRLVRMGAEREGSTDFSLYLRDPEGRRLGVSHYPTPDSRNTNARSPKRTGARGRRHA